MAFDFKKPFCARDGREARIYAYDGAGKLSVHGAIKVEGDWIPMAWTQEGFATHTNPGSSPSDLVNTPRKFRHEVIAVIFEKDFKLFDDRIKAERWLDVNNPAPPYAIKPLVIEANEGERSALEALQKRRAKR